jgi:hypothetical protein
MLHLGKLTRMALKVESTGMTFIMSTSLGDKKLIVNIIVTIKISQENTQGAIGKRFDVSKRWCR